MSRRIPNLSRFEMGLVSVASLKWVEAVYYKMSWDLLLFKGHRLGISLVGNVY